MSFNLNQKISKNFSFKEFFKVSAISRGYMNKNWSRARRRKFEREYLNPPENVIDNIVVLVTEILQPLRNVLGVPLTVNPSGGSRHAGLNKAAGGSSTSYHLDGAAADVEANYGLERFSSKCRDFIPNGYFPRSGNGMVFGVLWGLKAMDLIPASEIICEAGGFRNPNWVHAALQIRGKRSARQAVKRYVPPRTYYSVYNRKETFIIPEQPYYASSLLAGDDNQVFTT